MKDLEAENRALHRRLKVLMRWAEENEERMRRFQAQELRLLGINSLYELLLMLVHETRVKFKLEVITLVLLDGDHEIRHLLQHLGVKPQNFRSCCSSTWPRLSKPCSTKSANLP